MDTIQAIFNLLNADNCIVLNKTLLHSIGVAETLVYQSLLAKHNYYKAKSVLDADGYFFSSIEDLEDSTGLGRKAQDRAVDRLVSLGLVYKKLQGMPRRRYFAINYDLKVLTKYLHQEPQTIKESSKYVQNGQSSLSKMDNPVCPKGTNNTSEMDKQVCPKGTLINISNINLSKKNIRDINEEPAATSAPAPLTPEAKAQAPKKKAPEYHLYGEYKNVRLSDSDIDKLKTEYPRDYLARIESLSNYMASTGKSYKNHLATIRNWARMEQQREANKQAERNKGFYGINPNDNDAEWRAMWDKVESSAKEPERPRDYNPYQHKDAPLL